MELRYLSPLRYPGGKSQMAPWLASTFAEQWSPMPIEIWMEPFAGGAGAALSLLELGAVDEAWLSDANPGIAAFWHSVIDDGEAFARRVERTLPSMALWEACRAMIADPASRSGFDLGYAAFIVNRCSRSGIVAPTSGPMGGRNQTGQWRIDSRFNPVGLAERIRHVKCLAAGHRIQIVCEDGIDRIGALDDSGVEDEVMVFVDPPYLREGNRLYASGMSHDAHERLSAALNASPARWLLTYDDEAVVADQLYAQRRVLEYEIRNTANRSRVAREYAVFSSHLAVGPLPAPIDGHAARWVRDVDTDAV